MLKGIYMTLLIGPGVPVPAPKSLVDSLVSVQVNNGGDRSGFQMVFNISKKSPLRNIMLPAGFFDPGTTRVILVCTLGGIPNVLVDGIVTRHEVAPSNDAGQSTLTITGEDLSVLMDVVQMPFMRYPCMPPSARVAVILAKYMVFGIVPLIIPSPFEDIPLPTEEVPTQSGTDLAYIKKLAADVGWVFYVEPGPAPGTSIAYYGPDIRIPIPQPALTTNMDAANNVESLSFSLDGLSKKILVTTIMDPVTKKIPIPIPLPNISIVKPPLGARLTVPMKVEFQDDTANKNPIQALGKALGKLSLSADAITGSGTLNVLRYGHVLKARQLVGVRGAGLAYDGMYYVNTVTHNLKRGEYKQSFTISRDGLISQTPQVVP